MSYGKKKRIYLADLAYFNQYSSSITIPLNIGYIASYVLKLYGTEVEIFLFKNPRELLLTSKMNPPDVLGLSCYYWNMHMDILIASRVKQINPECIVITGGPHIDTDIEEQLDLYLSFNGCLDFIVLNEGELGFSKIIERLIFDGKNKIFHDEIDGCTFFVESNKPVCGKDIGLSLNLETLPSPILSGLLDNFLIPKFMPMIQTSRMCPYSCSYCCSGKLKGKIRKFPDTIVKAEIEYIAKKYSGNPHKTLRITDENFGINMRDSIIAEFLAFSKDKFGYPLQTGCYFDKKLSPTVQKSALLFAEMNFGGLQLAFQSFNKDSLKAVKRKNMSDMEMKEVVIWAHTHGLKTYSELIFGLPYETKQTFLDSLEFIMQIKIDTIAAHNLFLVKGIELNRKTERKKFELSTKYRPAPSSAYDIIDNEFVCESEEIVTSSSHFSFDDFIDVRKISLIFYVINAMEYFKKVFNFLIEHGQKVVPLLDRIMNPLQEHKDINNYLNFVGNFVSDIHLELFDTHEGVCSHLRDMFINNGNNVVAPTRLNVYYSSRLIYKEDWFPKVLSELLKKIDLDNQNLTILRDLMAISENEWIDVTHPARGKAVGVSEYTLDYLNIPIPRSRASKYLLKMKSSEQQREKIESYNKQYMVDESYYYKILDVIQPRKQLRYECVEVESFAK